MIRSKPKITLKLYLYVVVQKSHQAIRPKHSKAQNGDKHLPLKEKQRHNDCWQNKYQSTHSWGSLLGIVLPNILRNSLSKFQLLGKFYVKGRKYQTDYKSYQKYKIFCHIHPLFFAILLFFLQIDLFSLLFFFKLIAKPCPFSQNV